MQFSLRALAVVASLDCVASMASAEGYNTASMQQGLDTLETQIAQAFDEYQIDADPTTLSMAQIAVIIGVLDEPEKDSGGNDVKSAIEAAIRSKFNQ